MKIFLLLGAILLSAPLYAKKIKATLAPAYILNNEISHENGVGYGGGINLGYEVVQGHLFNIELSIANHFHHFTLLSDTLDVFRLGFGVRVILPLERMRPYFTHDIQSAYIWRSSQPFSANAVSVLLGLGLEFPVSETHSFIIDADYQFMNVSYFTVSKQKLSFLTLTLGWIFSV